MLTHPQRWPGLPATTVPSGDFAIDWGLPLTRGLVGAYVPGRGLYCLATGYKLGFTSSAKGIVSSLAGPALNAVGTSSGALSTAKVPASWLAMTAGSLFVFVDIKGNPSQTDSDFCTINYNFNGASPFTALGLSANAGAGTNPPQFVGNAGGTTWALQFPSRPSVGLHSLCGGFSSSRSDVYLDGVSVANDAGHGAISYGATPSFSLGTYGPFSSSKDPNLNVVAAYIYNRKLDDGEVLSLNLAPFQIFRPAAPLSVRTFLPSLTASLAITASNATISAAGGPIVAGALSITAASATLSASADSGSGGTGQESTIIGLSYPNISTAKVLSACVGVSMPGGVTYRGSSLAAPKPSLISDTVSRTQPTVSKPGYLQTITDPTFGTKITRITGDPGAAITNVSGGIWGSCSRHHYSLDQAWNADQSLLYLENNTDPDGLATGGNPSGHLFLDGSTYVPQFYQSPPQSDIRWHPTDPAKMFYTGGNVFGLWTPSTNATTVIRTFTGYSSLFFGHYKGFYSLDGDYHAFMAVNGSGQDVIFAYRVSDDTKFPDILSGTIDSVQISQSGQYLVTTGTTDEHTVYAKDGTVVQTWASAAGSQGQPSHSDVATDQNGDDVYVGVWKSTPYGGRIVKRRMSDGTSTPLTVASPASFGQHVSTRCTTLGGWAVATYPDNGASWPLYNFEVIAVKLDGSKVLRLCHTHASNTQADYYSQAQASVCQDGSRVIFASNWDDTGGTGRPVQAYVCDLRDTAGLV